jgi:ribonuclease PH
MRHDNREPDELRSVNIRRHFRPSPAGSVLIEFGRTAVLCTASVVDEVPVFLEGTGKGWLTAEYAMLPGSTSPRRPRERGAKVDGRTTEIQRLIGRSLRAVTNLAALGPRTVWVDCDVLEADGGTRTAAITGGWVALVDALNELAANEPGVKEALAQSVAAISVGLAGGRLVLDLDYREDSRAEVDMNVVMTGAGEFVEVQGSAEGGTFSQPQLDDQLQLARVGIERLARLQRHALGAEWPLD